MQKAATEHHGNLEMYSECPVVWSRGSTEDSHQGSQPVCTWAEPGIEDFSGQMRGSGRWRHGRTKAGAGLWGWTGAQGTFKACAAWTDRGWAALALGLWLWRTCVFFNRQLADWRVFGVSGVDKSVLFVCYSVCCPGNMKRRLDNGGSTTDLATAVVLFKW